MPSWFVCVPFPYGISGRMWNSIASAPDHCLFMYYEKIRDYNRIKSEVWICIFSFIVNFLPVMIQYCFFINVTPWLRLILNRFSSYSRCSVNALWKYLYLETLKGNVQNCYNITLSLIVKIKLICFIFWLSPLNSNFILLSDFPFMRPFQCPVYLSCNIIQSTSIALAYHLFIILTLKILPNSIFSIFLFCPLWRPIIIPYLVYRLGYTKSAILGERKSFNYKYGDQL